MQEVQFGGLLFDEKSAASGDVVQVLIEDQGPVAIRFEGTRELFPGERVTLDWSGISGEPVRVADGEKRVLFIQDPRVLELFAAGPGPLATKARKLRAAAGRWFKLWVAVGAVSLAIVLGLLYAVFAGSSFLLETVVERVPPAWERSLGQAAMADITAQKSVVAERAVTAPVVAILDRLTSALGPNPYRFELHVLADKEINAFALPGGQVAVLTGLLTKARSADEVAGVLAHELQHVIRRHGLRDVVEKVGLGLTLGILLGSHDVVRQCTGYLLETRFSRVQEAEADARGAELLLAAGIPVDGMADFFDRLASDGGTAERAVAFLSDHPASANRAAAIRAVAAAKGPVAMRPFGIDWESYKKTVEGAVGK